MYSNKNNERDLLAVSRDVTDGYVLVLYHGEEMNRDRTFRFIFYFLFWN